MQTIAVFMIRGSDGTGGAPSRLAGRRFHHITTPLQARNSTANAAINIKI
jgi:hypothetical protein